MPVNPADIDLIAARQVEVYKEAELQILGIVRDHLARGIDAPTWAQDRLTALGSLRRATLRVLAKLRADRGGSFRAAVSEAYRNGRGTVLTDLPGVTGAKAREAVKHAPRLDAIESLSAALIRDVGRRELNVLRHVQDVYREVQAAAVARSIAGGITRREASQAAWQGFVDQGVTSFTDVRGRTWRLTTYVEMAVRTVTMRAAVQGQLDRLGELGIPLVSVSNESQECPRCRPYEGKVLAISGPFGLIEAKSVTTGEMVTVDVMTTLDIARLAGLFHPNCRHTIRAYLPGATRLPAGPTEQPEEHKARERQREIERKIRGAKEQAVAALTPEAKTKAEAKVRAWQAEMRQHLKDNPTLKRLPYREEIGAGNLPPGGKAPSPAGRLTGPPQPKKTTGTKAPKKTAAAKTTAQAQQVGTTTLATGREALRQTPAVAPHAFLRDEMPTDLMPLTAAQRKALEDYASDAQRINDQIRRGKMSTRVGQTVRQLDGVMAGSGLRSDVEVWRGVTAGDKVFGSRLSGDLAGMEWTEEAFASTSADRRIAVAFAGMFDSAEPPVIMRLVVPKGTGAATISGFGSGDPMDGQAELLLQRGLRMRVVADHGVSPEPGIRSGVRRLDVEIVPVAAKTTAAKKTTPTKAVKKAAKKGIAPRKTALPPPRKPPATKPEDLTVPQLLALGRAHGVLGMGGRTKTDLIAHLRSWEYGRDPFLPGSAEARAAEKAARIAKAAAEAATKAAADKAAAVALRSLPPSPRNPTVLAGRGGKWWELLLDDTGLTPIRIRNLTLDRGSFPYTIASGSAYRIQGVVYIVEDGYAAKLTADELVRGLWEVHQTLPPDGIHHQHGYAWLAGRNPADAYWARQYHTPGFTSAATAGDGGTHVWNRGSRSVDYVTPSGMAHSLRHEFGHNVSGAVARQGMHDRSQLWADAGIGDEAHAAQVTIVSTKPGHKQLMTTPDRSKGYPRGVTDYGQSDAAEDFAESMELYLAGELGTARLTPGGPVVPFYFRDVWPARAAHLDKLMPKVAAEQRSALKRLGR